MLRCVGLISRPTDAIVDAPARRRTRGARRRKVSASGATCSSTRCASTPTTLDDVALLRASQDYRCPFLAVPAAVQFEPPLRLEGEVVFSCLKGAEDGDGLIMRVFNPGSEPGDARG